MRNWSTRVAKIAPGSDDSNYGAGSVERRPLRRGVVAVVGASEPVGAVVPQYPDELVVVLDHPGPRR
jgi:hypothetical protein